MGQKIFLSMFGGIFALLLLVQGYFAINENAVKEMRAERLGAEFVDHSEATAEAGENIGGMTVYLTFETEGNRSSHGTLAINGIDAGSFERGILTLALTEGDIVTVKNAVGETISITDYPEDLDSSALPQSLFCGETIAKWGKISFR